MIDVFYLDTVEVTDSSSVGPTTNQSTYKNFQKTPVLIACSLWAKLGQTTHALSHAAVSVSLTHQNQKLPLQHGYDAIAGHDLALTPRGNAPPFVVGHLCAKYAKTFSWSIVLERGKQ